jgi:peptide/nickel transport system permease protein
MARRLAVIVFTVVAATALAHVVLAGGVEKTGWGNALTSTPAGLRDRFVHGDFGVTGGGACRRIGPAADETPLCASYPAAEVSAMMRKRVPIDLTLLIGSLLIGTLAGVIAGRWCAIRPQSKRTQAIRVVTAFQLSAPSFFQALVVLFYFSANVSGFLRLPFVSGSGQYAPLGDDPLLYVQTMWAPCVLAALPLAAFVTRFTESTLRDELDQDYVRTALSKGVSMRRAVNLHAMPVAVPPITAMAAVNVSTLLLNVAIMEYIFAIPGMFRISVTATLHHDVPVLEALVIEGVILVTLANLLVDAIQARLDPRVE